MGVKGELNTNWKGGVFEYPNHYEMKKNRLIVLKEANYICFNCGRKATEIHHADLSKDNHSLNNLTAACHKCNCLPKFRNKTKTSKYIKIYGKTLKELSVLLNCSNSKVLYLSKRIETELRI